MAWILASESSSIVMAVISSPFSASRRDVKSASVSSASFLSLLLDKAEAGPTAEAQRMLMADMAEVRSEAEVWVRKVLEMSSQRASYACNIS